MKPVCDKLAFWWREMRLRGGRKSRRCATLPARFTPFFIYQGKFMGLFDSVLGAVTNNAQGGGGLSDLIGMVSNNPQLLQAAASMLGNDGGVGGLEGLVAKFQQAGLGDVIGSWIGSGQNQAISADQLSNVLGSDALSGLAGKLGIDQSDVAGQLSNILPGLVDKLTPAGQSPAGGLGNSSDLMGALGALLKG
jgi:uncharacterized protein YidB (DUF937 family)